MNNKCKFTYISKEIERQCNLIFESSKTLDSKAERIMIFNSVVIGYILYSNDFIKAIKYDYLFGVVFVATIVLIIISIYFAYRGYQIRDYSLGGKISSLIEKYRKNEVEDFNMYISHQIKKCCDDNSKVNEKKANSINISIYFLTTGTFIFILLKLIY